MLSSTPEFLTRLLPFLRWFPLSRQTLHADFVAGITVSLVLVPQSLAYAQLAGLPAYFGLYAAFLPVLIGAAWGSSNQLATGPVAMVSILTASTLSQLASPGSEQFIAYAITLALLVGVMQTVLGVFRLGSIVSFLSHPVIVGFTNAAAIIIALSQLNKVLGVSIGRSEHFLKDMLEVLQQIADTHLPTLGMGIGAIALIALLRRIAPKFPAVLFTVVLSTLVSWSIGFERNAHAPIESLTNDDARTLATEHRNTAAEINKLNRSIAGRLDEAQSLRSAASPNHHHLLTLEYQIQAQRLELRALENENRLRARALRQFHFQQESRNDGVVRLHFTGELPADALSDPHSWRIQRISDGTLFLVGGGEVVGRIPEGLPELRLPQFDLGTLVLLFSSALVITLVGFMEAISVAKSMATKTRQRIDPNQELIGQGLANLVGSFSQSYPVSGSFSRSAVNISAGARTGMSSVIAGCIVLVTLLYLTPLLYHLPQAVLAAIIMTAVYNLIDLSAIKHAWQAHRHDGICALITFAATLGFAPHLDIGILFGGGLAIIMFLYRTMSPRVTVRFHPANPGSETQNKNNKGVVAISFDGRLYFANVPYFEDAVLDAAAKHTHANAVLVIGEGINEIDASGEDVLRHLFKSLRDGGIAMAFAGLKPQVLAVLKATGLYDEIGPSFFFRDEREALRQMTGDETHASVPSAASPSDAIGS